MKKPICWWAPAVSALALSAAPAWAQDSAVDEALTDDIVVNAQRNNQTEVARSGSVGVLGDKDAGDVPFSIKSYNEQLILNQQPQSLGQVLENDPSIRTTYGFGNAAEQFVIRGFALFGDDVGLNGLYGITPRQLVAPELYGSVQVLNGASAFLNGAAPSGTGFGGNVNLLTKVAGNDPLTRVTANYTSSSHFGGSFDVARRFGANDEWGVRVNGAFRSGDVAINDEFRRAAVIGAALDYRGDRGRVIVDVAYQRYEVDRLRPTVTLGFGVTAIPEVPDADHNYGQAFTSTEIRDIFGTVRAEYDIADNALLYATVGSIDGREDGTYGGLTVTNALTGAADGSASIIPYERNGTSATAGLRVKLQAGGVTNEFNLGGSHIWQVNRTAYDFRYANAGFGVPYQTNLYVTPQVPLPTGFSFAGGDLNDPFPISRSRIGSAFASDTLGLFDDRVLITGGVRLQNIQQSSYSYADGSLVTRYSESAVTPVVGVVVKPTDGVSLFANRIEGLAAGATAPNNADTLNAGEVFAPYKTRQYEVGGKLLLGRFNLSLAAFQIDLPSAYVTPTPTATNVNAVTFGYFGRQRNRGLELSLDGEPVRGLRIIAGGTYIDAKLRQTAGGLNEGNEVFGVPEWLANANVEWDLPFGATMTGRVVHTGDQWYDNANTVKLDDWTRFDVGARYVVPLASAPLTLRFTIDNVADKRYWASSFGSFGPALLQGQPRTFKASASIDF
ncbi:TonB-dependent receptor [Sphingomonas sp. Y38-1Y]|uniref:TonB-dependent receptor n=1 Tax=Sphingomonas sp. Y38-1Y TaxID=3078265 RepID=UPI0028E2754F|nr:TonB-dependent receptor [Sphingomonas sp. Y38-1Y]